MNSNKTKSLLLACLSFLLIGLYSCGSDDEPGIDCSTSDLTIAVQSTTEATCLQGGSITVSASGGDGNYEFSLDGTSFQSSTQFSNMTAGNFSVVVRDGNECTANTTATVGGDIPNISVSTNVVNAGGCNESQGSISATATGGNGTFEFSIDGGAFGSSGVFANLTHGQYTVTARDEDGCEGTRSARVPSGISYTNSVRSIINNSCAISGCHVSGTGRADFTSFATVQANASAIKTRTQSGDMPRGSTLNQDEKDRIACWVDDGAPNN